MTQLQDRTPYEPVTGGGGPGNTETRTAEQTVDAVVATADAVFHSLREGQDAAAGVVRQWAGRLAGVPFTALTEGGGSVMSGRVWVDCTFEMVDVLVEMQRRSVLQLVGLQQRTAGLLVESGLALAGASRGAAEGAHVAQTDRTDTSSRRHPHRAADGRSYWRSAAPGSSVSGCAHRRSRRTWRR